MLGRLVWRRWRTPLLARRPLAVQVQFIEGAAAKVVVDVEAAVGTNLLELAHKHGVDLEGACDGVWTSNLLRYVVFFKAASPFVLSLFWVQERPSHVDG